MGTLKGQLLVQVGNYFAADARSWVMGFARAGECPCPDRFVRFTHDELQAVARLMVVMASRPPVETAMEAVLFGDSWYVGEIKFC